MIVSKIMNTVGDYAVTKPVNAISKTKIMDKVCTHYQNNNLKVIGGLGILSIVLKDGLGCYMYVKQSLNNKKIPEEKRKFVAALDLANGGLMVVTQLLTFFTLSKKSVQAKMFNSAFGRKFDRAARKGYQALIMKNPKFKNLSGREFNMTFDAFKGKTQDTFGVLTALVASTILAKRILVPFIATPLAEKAKGVLYKSEGNAPESTAQKTESTDVTSPAKGTDSPNFSKNTDANQSNLLAKFKGQKS